jgi:hypothetical protein
MITGNQWSDLWHIATDDPGGPATILVSEDTNDEVTLEWPDGSSTSLYWHNDKWQFPEGLDIAPCDVAARDTL